MSLLENPLLAEIIEKPHEIVVDDPKIKVRKDLGMRNVTAKWVPRLLTINQKHQRVRDSKCCLNLFNRYPSDFLRRLVTIDERRIHYYTPESKQQAKR